MDTNAPVRLDKTSLTKLQLDATRIMLYQMADIVNRLLADEGTPYTKVRLT